MHQTFVHILTGFQTKSHPDETSQGDTEDKVINLVSVFAEHVHIGGNRNLELSVHSGQLFWVFLSR